MTNFRLVCCTLVVGAAMRSPAAERVDFAHDVLPLLKARCAECHTAGTYKAGLSMDTRQALLQSEVVVPGRSGKSRLIERITSDDPLFRMPPKGKPLTPRQIDLLRGWIDQNLPWQQGFSFAQANQPRPLTLRRPELPPVQQGRTNPVDRIIDAYYERHGLTRPAPLEDAAFLRRVSLDLVGLLPSPQQQQAFLADDDPHKRTKLVRELLNRDRRYAEHWLTFWNDLLRNDYSGTGYIDGGRKPITGWLYRSLLENKPYDQFVRQLISPAPESEGFIRGIKWRGRVNASQSREIQFAQNVAQVFLGINLKCASCHDSFIDDWKLKDSYGLAAVVAEGPLEIHRCDKPTGQFAQAAFLFPEVGTVDPEAPRAERLKRTAELMTSSENGRLARTIVNRIWQRLMGRGLVEPVDVIRNEAWSEELLEYLAVDLVEGGYDLKRTMELIVTSRAYQSRCPVEKQQTTDGFVFRGPVAKRMTAEQFIDAVWRITGTAPQKPAAPLGDRAGEPVRASLVNADALMRSLGRPNREQVVTTRPDQLTTLQALDLSNGPILAGILSRGARNLRRAHPEWTADEMIAWIYRAALCRPPTDDERSISRQILGPSVTDAGLADLLWAVFMLPEFQTIR